MRCKKRSRQHGRCRQDARFEGLCGYHLRRRDHQGHVDQYYEGKVFKGLVEPTDHYMSETEVRALFEGRTKNDGRRIDHWTRR